MKRANVVNEEACQSLLLKMRDEGSVRFDIHEGRGSSDDPLNWVSGATDGSCAKSLASSPPNPRADEDRDGALSLGKGGMIVGPWRISQVVLFNLFARTAELRESLF